MRRHVGNNNLGDHTGLHDGAFGSAVVGDSGVLVEVANTAVVAVRPVPCSTTERSVRVTVSARVVADASPDAVGVGVGAIVFITAVKGRRKHHPMESGSGKGPYEMQDRQKN